MCAMLGEEMFERFTDEARRVLVLAQEEARLLKHNFIGSEHLLLGLIRQGDGVAAQALGSLGIRLEVVREEVQETIGPAGRSTSGSPPFTPRAKRVLEMSLREALQLGHNYIGTEHILLGLVREGESVAAEVLVSLGADLSHVRQRVIELASGADVPAPETEGEAVPALVARPRCSRCRASLSKSARYTTIEAASGDEVVEGQGLLSMTVFYCGGCGTVIGVPVEPGPELDRP
jgi:ATP-dependent Clp protease ATP-binding subunit ClpA